MGSGADLVVRQGVQFLVLLILARLLTPADFGTIALLAVYVLVGCVLADAGLTTALLQAKGVTVGEVDSAFWTSVVLGLLLTGIGVAIASPLAQLADRPDLVTVASFMCLTILSTAVGQVHATMLVRALAFGRLLVIGLVAALLSGAVSIWVALEGGGLWALAVQSVAMPTVAAVLLLLVSPWRPGKQWSRNDTTSLIRRGRWVLAANLVDHGYLRLHTLITGVAFGTAALGTYQRADSTQQLTTETTSAVVGRVALPLFARTSGRADLLRAGFLTGIRSVSALNAWAMAVLAALASPVLMVFFGEQWAPAAPLLSILCAAGLLWPFHVMSISVLYATGANRQVFRIDLAKKVAGLTLLGVGLTFGLKGVAWAQVGLGVVALVINGRTVQKAVGLGLREQLSSVAPVFALAGIVGLGASAASSALDTEPWIRLIVVVPLSGVAYLMLAASLRVRAVTDLLILLRPVSNPPPSGPAI
ncbi:lipopolysaccharide biosynthesis protein [Knoellia aerolata]|nr:lipopolysaccharide biosynthesis protein [Knoellia aerolata]